MRWQRLGYPFDFDSADRRWCRYPFDVNFEGRHDWYACCRLAVHDESTYVFLADASHCNYTYSLIHLGPPMGVPTLGPIIHDHRDTASTSPAPASESIVTVASSSKHLAVPFPIAEPSTAKKKSTLALLNPFSSKTPADPFPPDTPTKAARLLGEFSDSDDDENAPPKKSWKRKAKQMSDALLFRSPPPTLSRSQADLTDYRAPDADLETDFVYSIGSSTPATDRKGKGKGKGKAKAPTIMSKIEEDSSDDEESALVNEPASFPPRGDSLGVSVRSPLQAVEDELLDEMEEVKIGVVEVVMARRVRPEEVKLVNIPARKKVCL